MRLRTVCLLLVLGASAPAHADDKVKPSPMAAADAEKWLAHFNELVDTVGKHKAECAPLAAAVNGVVDRNVATIQMTWAAQKAKKTLPKEVIATMDRRGGEMVSGLQKCWNDPAVKTAFARMKVPKEKPKAEAP